MCLQLKNVHTVLQIPPMEVSFIQTNGKIFEFLHLREETFNTFEANLNPQTVVHNWWFLAVRNFTLAKPNVQLCHLKDILHLGTGWDLGSPKAVAKGSDAFFSSHGV